MISAGILKQTATAYDTSGTDDLGHASETLDLAGTFRCDLRDQGASEQAWGDGVATVRQMLIVARWLDMKRLGLTERHRLTIGSRTFRILAIRNIDERDRRAEIDCVEIN
jgi:hypothetical protein